MGSGLCYIMLKADHHFVTCCVGPMALVKTGSYINNISRSSFEVYKNMFNMGLVPLHYCDSYTVSKFKVNTSYLWSSFFRSPHSSNYHCNQGVTCKSAVSS